MKKVVLVLALSLAFNTLSAQELTIDLIYENNNVENPTSLTKYEKVDHVNDYHYLQYSLSGLDLSSSSFSFVRFEFSSKEEIIDFIEGLILTKNDELKTFSVGYALNMRDYISVYDTDINKFMNITTKELHDVLESLKQ